MILIVIFSEEKYFIKESKKLKNNLLCFMIDCIFFIFEYSVYLKSLSINQTKQLQS